METKCLHQPPFDTSCAECYRFAHAVQAQMIMAMWKFANCKTVTEDAV